MQDSTETITHETVVTDSAGNENSVVETTTREIETETPAPVEVEEIEEDGIDESWLNEKFSALSGQLSTLSEQLTQNQITTMELVNNLIAMNQQLQLTITEMASKLTALSILTPVPSSPEVTPIPEAETPPASASADAPQEAPTPKARKATRRKI